MLLNPPSPTRAIALRAHHQYWLAFGGWVVCLCIARANFKLRRALLQPKLTEAHTTNTSSSSGGGHHGEPLQRAAYSLSSSGSESRFSRYVGPQARCHGKTTATHSSAASSLCGFSRYGPGGSCSSTIPPLPSGWEEFSKPSAPQPSFLLPTHGHPYPKLARQ